MKVALYVRVSTQEKTVETQEKDTKNRIMTDSNDQKFTI
jgi:DNA invertase Pin-like site-specific DNA recombinase